MIATPLHLPGRTRHTRRGGPENAFAYGVDYLLIDPERDALGGLASRNRFNLFAVHDRDHGGRRGAGTGVAWARAVFAGAGLVRPDLRILLLTQPRFLGYGFNPVSFWLAMAGDDLIAVIAEVNNPFGDRHSYLCHLPGFAAIGPGQVLTAEKVFHVSPFQRIAGSYRFRFDVSAERIVIAITLVDGEKGLRATLEGPLRPLTTGGIVGASLRRPAGALRTIVLIYWQALKLKAKGARYRVRPEPPSEEVT
ncbi:MAG: DUF1365 domain-containing protein [Maritimibacter sp.]|nr:DUF1365 domain-containing protein [Maritimibacter sp.]